MKITRKFVGIAAAAAALAVAVPVTAQATTVMVSGQFVGGGTVSGSISYGSGSMWNLTTTGGPDGGFDYTNANSSIVAFTPSTFDVVEYVGFPNSISDVHLVFGNNLFGEPNGATDPLLSSSYECFNSFTCPNSEPSFPGFELRNVAVPEPATWALLMLGVGLLGAGLRFARNSQAPVTRFA